MAFEMSDMAFEMSDMAFEMSASRKARGAFFTPPAIAEFLARWAIANDPDARVLDPTCGEAVFLLAAGERLRELGAGAEAIKEQLTGVDLHQPSLNESGLILTGQGLGARLVRSDFFELLTPAQIGDQLGWQDAVVGNPPFVRYQEHRGEARKRSASAALAQGVRLSGLASSWAATLVHASAFLKPTGRLAMVMPAELLTVHYAEPVRRWLRQRFQAVNLVMFERLQFRDAEERVVLLVARGIGPCDSFCLFHVDHADDLAQLHPLDPVGANPAAEGKWSDLVLPLDVRQLFKRTALERMARLDEFGAPELGTVTRLQRVLRTLGGHPAQVRNPREPPEAGQPARDTTPQGAHVQQNAMGGTQARRRARLAALSTIESSGRRAQAVSRARGGAKGARGVQVHRS